MAISGKLQKAFELFDAANENDPNKERFQGKIYAKEVLYANRMTHKLNDFAPDAGEALKLTARCQHICRWEIPRDTYEMNRAGYLKWRQDLKRFHAGRATVILKEVGYADSVIDKVAFLLEKKQLKKNEATQTLEDVICLVFLQFYFDSFTEKHREAKVIEVLQKTWRKMSEKGHAAALQIPFSANSLALVSKAIKGR